MILTKSDFEILGVEENFDVTKFLSSLTPEKSRLILSSWNQVKPWVSPILTRGPFEIFDFTQGYDANRKLKFDFGIGRYNEDRVGMYTSELFNSESLESRRTIHMGVDLGAPAGTPCFAPTGGRLLGTDFLNREGDYGGTILIECEPPEGMDCPNLYMLFGHLAKASLRHVESVGEIQAGDLIGWLGERHENGGWNPHLHWQLSWAKPVKVDLPGAVSKSFREKGTRVFPDPTEALALSIGGWN